MRSACFGGGAWFFGGGTEREDARGCSWDDGKFVVVLQLGFVLQG